MTTGSVWMSCQKPKVYWKCDHLFPPNHFFLEKRELNTRWNQIIAKKSRFSGRNSIIRNEYRNFRSFAHHHRIHNKILHRNTPWNFHFPWNWGYWNLNRQFMGGYKPDRTIWCPPSAPPSNFTSTWYSSIFSECSCGLWRLCQVWALKLWKFEPFK